MESGLQGEDENNVRINFQMSECTALFMHQETVRTNARNIELLCALVQAGYVCISAKASECEPACLW